MEVGSGAVAELLSNTDSATFHLKQDNANTIKLDWNTSVEMAAARSSIYVCNYRYQLVAGVEEVRDHGTYWTSILQKYKLLTATFLMTVSVQDAINTSPSHPPL